MDFFKPIVQDFMSLLQAFFLNIKNSLRSFFIYPDPEYTLEFILFALFVFVIVDQLYYFWFVYGRLIFYKEPKWESNGEAVSVVICAKNEYLNLKENLPKILNQNYPNYEVIVVNDASDDLTGELLEEFEYKYPKLKIVTIKENLNFFSGKKFALSIGIKSAKNDLLILTDADCTPNSEYWIKKMIEPFCDKEVEIVLGYSPYIKRKGLLNALIRLDTLQIAMQYLSYALRKKAYMGVGRNLAYRKTLFLENNGFISHYKVSSGDDDLFINQVANKKNTRIQIHPDSFIFSEPKRNYIKWINQKRRHLTTVKFYKPKFKFRLGKLAFSQFLMFGLLTVLLILDYFVYWVFGLFFLRVVSQLIIFKRVKKLLKYQSIILFTPILELILFLNHLLLSASNMMLKQNKWK